MKQKQSCDHWSCKFKYLKPEERVHLLNEHMMSDVFEVGQKVYCLHCNGDFLAEKVGIDEQMSTIYSDFYFRCPNDCDGSPLDFSALPWWDPNRCEPDEEVGYRWKPGCAPDSAN